MPKYFSELRYWKKVYSNEDKSFENSFYKKYFLQISNEADISFLNDKIVVDFGSGPRGTMKWITNSRLNIGIDVLADKYVKHFGKDMINHNMLYITSTEHYIPIYDNFADIVFSINSLDHVDNFPTMCSEIIRILKPNGLFIGSFNLNEPASSSEPQNLTEKKIKKYLLKYFEIQDYRISNFYEGENRYQLLFENKEKYDGLNPAALWVRAKKRMEVI